MKNVGSSFLYFLYFVFGSLAATILVIGSLVIMVPIVVFELFRSLSKRRKKASIVAIAIKKK